MKDRQQPIETLGKIVTYMCGGRWHHPTFADRLTWSTKDVNNGGMISPYGIITDWKVVKCSKKVIERLKADMDIGVLVK